MPRGVGAVPKKAIRAPRAHKLAEEFPTGTILQDLYKKQWQLSSVIGQGGFGLIYLASEEVAKQVDKKAANNVVKIEPKDNGPLYCEMQFYQRVAKPNSIQSFITYHKLRYLSVPPYISTGRHVLNSKEFRFLVMPRFGTDLQKYLVQSGGHFSPKTTFSIGLRMLDALQFLHENEYVHADVKAANILTGFHAGSEVMNEVYLVDYGLAYRYTVEGVHKEYKEDPRKAHDGTIEFTSRDAHKGVAPSRRADLEILGYCLLQWLCGKLPWEDKLSDPRYVADSKERLAGNPPLLVAACLPGPRTPSLEYMCKYMEKVNALGYESKPDYKSFRDLLRAAGQKAGLKDEWKLNLGVTAGMSPSKGTKRKSGEPGALSGTKKKRSTAGSPLKSCTPKNSAATSLSKRSTPRSSQVKSPRRGPSPKISTAQLTPKKSATKIVRSKAKKSPIALPVPSKAAAVLTNGRAKAAPKKKIFQMPPGSKMVESKASCSSNKRTVRRVRRVVAVQSDRGIQTSPGLLNNRC